MCQKSRSTEPKTSKTGQNRWKFDLIWEFRWVNLIQIWWKLVSMISWVWGTSLQPWIWKIMSKRGQKCPYRQSDCRYSEITQDRDIKLKNQGQIWNQSIKMHLSMWSKLKKWLSICWLSICMIERNSKIHMNFSFSTCKQARGAPAS